MRDTKSDQLTIESEVLTEGFPGNETSACASQPPISTPPISAPMSLARFANMSVGDMRRLLKSSTAASRLCIPSGSSIVCGIVVTELVSVPEVCEAGTAVGRALAGGPASSVLCFAVSDVGVELFRAFLG